MLDLAPLPAPRIVACHADFLVVDKPPGTSFHGEAGQTSLIDNIRQLSGENTLHPVHRLDRITSGLLLFARHAEAARQLGALFSDGALEKYYLALSAATPRKKQGWIKGSMIKGRNGSWRLGPWPDRQAATTSTADGPAGDETKALPAVTQFFSYGLGNGLRLFVVRPRSGRTHQIRVALKAMASPILGDRRYGGAAADRGYLHAAALRFDWQGETCQYTLLPDSGEHFLSPDCTRQLATLGPLWQLPWPGEKR